jgi:hypothetical protein
MWQKGPLPKDTFGWGGVVVAGANPANGFHFADFHGDHVIIDGGTKTLKAYEVELYDNSLTAPPKSGG